MAAFQPHLANMGGDGLLIDRVPVQLLRVVLVQEVTQDLAPSTPLRGFPSNDHFIFPAVQEGEVIWRRRCSYRDARGSVLPGGGQTGQWGPREVMSLPWWVPTLWGSDLASSVP